MTAGQYRERCACTQPGRHPGAHRCRCAAGIDQCEFPESGMTGSSVACSGGDPLNWSIRTLRGPCRPALALRPQHGVNDDLLAIGSPDRGVGCPSPASTALGRRLTKRTASSAQRRELTSATQVALHELNRGINERSRWPRPKAVLRSADGVPAGRSAGVADQFLAVRSAGDVDRQHRLAASLGVELEFGHVRLDR